MLFGTMQKYRSSNIDQYENIKLTVTLDPALQTLWSLSRFTFCTSQRQHLSQKCLGGHSTHNCIDLGGGDRGRLYIEHDSVIMVHRNGNYYDVHEVLQPNMTTIQSLELYVNTMQEGSASSEVIANNPMIIIFANLTKAIKLCLKIYELVRRASFMHLRYQSEQEAWAPGCSCPAAYSNTKYSDYNQPWSEHVSCNTLRGDASGIAIDYKPCFGPDSCSFEETRFCCGFDDVQCSESLHGRCVDAQGLAQLDREEGYCNMPFPGCVYGSEGVEPTQMSCKAPTDAASTFRGMTSTLVASSALNTLRSQYGGTDPNEGVVYIDGKPIDRRRSNYAFSTPGCHPCTNGRFNSLTAQGTCRSCPGGYTAWIQ